jgi:hypothetical protein
MYPFSHELLLAIAERLHEHPPSSEGREQAVIPTNQVTLRMPFDELGTHL